MSKIIKAMPDQLEKVLPFGFDELQRERKKTSPGESNMFGGLSQSSHTSQLTEDPQPSLQELMLNAERKAQELEEQAYRRAYEQGQKDGFDVGQRSMAIVKEHLEQLLKELQGTPVKIFEQYRDWLIETCLAISRHIVRRELTADSTQLIRLIDSLLREAAEEHSLTLAVHPDDLALLEQHLELKDLAERTGRIFTLKADAHMERGGCRVESNIQLIDASIEKQFDLVEQALRNDEPVTDQILT